MDAALAFAKLAATLRYEDLPSTVIELTKRDILDTLGVTLAGSSSEGVEGLVRVIAELGGKPESSIIDFASKVPSPEAALVNGFMARCVDYDDMYDIAPLHAGAVVVSAALAAAERKGGVTGRELITAVALGMDVICRMGLARTEGRSAGWVSTVVYGYFGATVAAARILGLGEEKTVNALGIVSEQAAGTHQPVAEGVLTKNLDVGLAARAGVFSALVAQKGMTGAHNCLEGKAGLFNVYHRGNYNSRALTKELGKTFEVANLSFKPYPCARPVHALIDLALMLRQEHSLDAEDITQVAVHVGYEPHVEFHPVKEKQNPKTVTDAQFSIPYGVAVALKKGAVVLDDFTSCAIKDPGVIALAQKVIPRFDSSMNRERETAPAKLEITTSTGTYSKRIEYPYGHPKNPMSADSLVHKFKDCAAHARKPLPSENISKVVDMVTKLDELDDVGDVIQLLS